MYNTIVNIFKHTRQSNADKYGATADHTYIEAQIEPASQTLVAPINQTIGISHNIYIDSFTSLGLKTGDKLVNVDDASEFYIINSAVQVFKDADVYHYEFVADKPND